jgi:protein-disulfide isomerase
MRLTKTTAILLLTAAVAAPAFAKKDKTKDKPEATPAPVAAGAAAGSEDTRPAATVAGKTITLEELDRSASSQLMRIRQQEYQVRMDVLEGMIQQKLIADEAAARKVSEADLLKTEVEDKTTPPTADEVAQYYEKMKARMGGKTLDEVKGDIEKALFVQKQNERRAQFLTELSTKSDVKIMLDPPRVAITIPPSAPSMGPADAPIVIVEWSDYQCPFCKRAAPTVNQVLSEYKGKIRFVYRDYPLPFHKQAMPSSLAAHCAEDQGKFWEYHNNLFDAAGDLSEADLTKRASDLGLDMTKFNACMQAKTGEAAINAAYNDGAAVGVTGTPAFFINGRMLVGAQPFEQFKTIIDDELTRKGLQAPKAAAGTN